MVVDYVDQHDREFGVAPVCAVPKHSGVQTDRSTYYATKTRPPSARSISDAASTALIEWLHAQTFGVYGARDVDAELHWHGHPVARHPSLRQGVPVRGNARYTQRLADAGAVAEYIDWFNRRRLHGEIGFVPLAEYEDTPTTFTTPPRHPSERQFRPPLNSRGKERQVAASQS
ncbi:hypothetical protein [Blastococcus deserti]|uniref:Integrase-like protein n=1 Tax=Blastococcus deserti TaxID=2259033 RepID=A0ABW4X9T4_9ACTN